MNDTSLNIPFENSLLQAVPAIHYRHFFAGKVYRSCIEERPDAIAVELGPHTASAIWHWLREITEKDGDGKDMPVMLGLTSPNRMIRPELRERAIRLQQELNLDLSDIPPEILNRELECADHSIICLTPTDSIIEAIRCAVELDVPLYGIDLDRTARAHYESNYLIEDPAGSNGRFSDYVEANEAWCAIQRDDPIDTRRETAMVARLKGLLEKHRRVLFTCGIGHWLNIRKLLNDRGVRPSHLLSEASRTTPAAFRRICVHPLIAVSFMDAFPAMASAYQQWRRQAGSGDVIDHGMPALSPTGILRNLLMAVYHSYFAETDATFRRAERHGDLEGLQRFESYLHNLCLLNLRANPDFRTIVSAARETMSGDFVKAVVRELLDFPWATPDNHGDCGLLVPDRNGGGSPRYRIEYGGGEEGNPLIINLSTKGRQVDLPYVWEWLKQKALRYKSNFVLHTWVPWERLISSLSLRAGRTTWRVVKTTTTRPFEGSLLEGIDVKSTVRASSRGEDKLLVRDVNRKRHANHIKGFDGFPIVWILNQDDKAASDFTVLYESGDWIEKYVKDRSRVAEVIENRGSNMVALIAYGESNVRTAASTRDTRIRSDRYQGILMYQPICWSREQFAHWAELTGYRRNPFNHYGLFNGDFVQERVASVHWNRYVEKQKPEWETALILLAIPFANGIVTIVAPDDYKFNPDVYEKARNFGVELCRVPLHSFSADEIETLSINHMIPGIAYDPECIAEESIEEAIGQKQTENEHLVPRFCLDFGR